MTDAPGGWSGAGAPAPAPTCPRHPDQVSYVRCQRCTRPVCPSCQQAAAVGVQCVDCVAEARRGQPQQVTVLGGRATLPGRVGADRPVVTLALIGTCILVWIGELVSARVFAEVAFVPALGDREPWRLLTSAFAHSPSSPFHILFNMMALWVVGQRLEQLLGPLRYLGLYLASALAGGVVWLLFQPAGAWVPVVGASGAVFGLFGALFVVERHLGRDASGMVGVVAINAVLGFLLPNVAWQAHLGGLVAGAALALALVAARRRGSAALAWGAIGAVVALCAVLVVGYYAVGGLVSPAV